MEHLILLGNTTLRLLLAICIGGGIGWERARSHHPAGVRTHMLVTIGAAVIMLLGSQTVGEFVGTANSDPARLGAQVISGIGFLGAGTILVTGRQEVKGLTTAAGLWASACMGLAIGAGFYECVVLCTVLIFLCMRFLPAFENYLVEKARFINIYVEFRMTSARSSAASNHRARASATWTSTAAAPSARSIRTRYLPSGCSRSSRIRRSSRRSPRWTAYTRSTKSERGGRNAFDF